jgi:hypothetical protein
MAHAQDDPRPYLARLVSKRYFTIVIILAVITAVELVLAGALEGTGLDVGFIAALSLEGTPLGVGILAFLSIVKIVLVAMYYMHLYGDNPFFTAAFLVPVPFVLLIVGALLVQFGVLFGG